MICVRRAHVLAAAVLAAATLLGGTRTAQATIVFATSFAGNAIVQVDTSTNSVTLLENTPGNADSLVFDPSGRIIYDDLENGFVRLFDPNLHTDTPIVGGLVQPADVVLEPGGNTILVSEFGGAKIDRVDLTTHAVSVLAGAAVTGPNPEGLAYDNVGRLFANLGTRDAGADKFVAQLDPVTGAIIHQSINLSGLDGLTYDPFTNKLYATSFTTGAVYSLDPTTLAVTLVLPAGSIPGPDGIVTDNLGNLLIASNGDGHIYSFNTTTSALNQLTFVNGLDDIAPVSGRGSPQLPEPSSFALAGMGLLILGGLRLRRRPRPKA